MMMEPTGGHSIMCTSQTSDRGVRLINRTYREPRTPSLFTALTMGNDSFNPAVYGHQTNAIPYPHGANIQLTVYNWDDGFHPFHFHGYVYLPPIFT
jgi:FtsP/CotA-like multicopper oxidase with cupredoxin domain